MGRCTTRKPAAAALAMVALGCGAPEAGCASELPPGMCAGAAEHRVDGAGVGFALAQPGSRTLDPGCVVTIERLPADAVLVDVRSEPDYAALSAPGSINLAPAAVAGRRFLRDRSPVLVGLGGRYRDLEVLCLDLRAKGFSRTRVLWNGLRALDAAGRLEGEPAAIVRSQSLNAEEFLRERHYRHWRTVVPDQALSERWLDDLRATVKAGEQVLVLAPDASDAAVFSQWLKGTAAPELYLLSGGMDALDRALAVHEAARLARTGALRAARRCPLTP